MSFLNQVGGLAAKAGGALVKFCTRRALRSHFRAIYVRGHRDLAGIDTALLLCPNHTNWWDGYLAERLMGVLPERSFSLLQQKENLDRYPWFKLAGIEGIDLRNSRTALGGVRRSLQILESRKAALWLFPQGQIRAESQTVDAEKGATFLSSRSGAHVAPVGIRYRWLGEAKPSIVVSFGKTLPPSPTPEELSSAINRELSQIDQLAEQGELSTFDILNAPLRSIDQRWDRLASVFSKSKEP